MTQLTPELEASLRIAIDPIYANQPGTESHERAALLGEIDRLRAAQVIDAARIAELERKLADAYAAAKQGVQIMATDRRRALDAEAQLANLRVIIRTIHDLDSTAEHTRELCAVALQECAA